MIRSNELQKQGVFGPKETFDVSNTIRKITDSSFPAPPPGTYTYEFLEAVKNCQCADALDIYKALSEDIHGAPWSGPGVDVYVNQMSPDCACVIDFIASELGLGATPKTIVASTP